MKFTQLPQYIAIIILATFLTFFFHEMSHWVAYELLGYDAGFTLNGASVKDSSIELTKAQRMITSAAGPIFTLFQALLFYFILMKHKSILWYPFLFLPFIMRLGAGWANQFEPNDEGRISLDLGLNLYALSTLIVAFLFFLIYRTSKRNQITLLQNVITFILCAIVMFGLVYIDFKFKIRFV